MRRTAFVGHADCSRHDTGWRHPDHQGRLPAIVRAVYRDMLVLHDHLLEMSGEPAREADLLRVHGTGYLDEVKAAVARAAAAGSPVEGPGGTMVSGASWEAALAAAGTVLTGTRAVLEGKVESAFCLARPEGRGAGPEGGSRFALVDNVAVAAAYAAGRTEAPVLVIDWAAAPAAWGRLSALSDAGVRIAAPGTPAANEDALTASVEEALEGRDASLFLLAASFEDLAGDTVGAGERTAVDLHRLTGRVRELAAERAGGRLVSALEGGYEMAVVAPAVVHHLRALADLPPP
jgi:acetoin utilization deacetylase AcuC-like enzyme